MNTKEIITAFEGLNGSFQVKVYPDSGFQYLKDIEIQDIERYLNQGKTVFFDSAFLSFGDYDNSCQVERSNVRFFWDEYGHIEGVIHESGSYGHDRISLNISLVWNNREIIQALESLESYPVLCEQTMYEVEVEMLEDYVSNCLRSDISFEDEETEQRWQDLDSDKQDELIHTVISDECICPLFEMGGNVYIDEAELIPHLKKLLEDE